MQLCQLVVTFGAENLYQRGQTHTSLEGLQGKNKLVSEWVSGTHKHLSINLADHLPSSLSKEATIPIFLLPSHTKTFTHIFLRLLAKLLCKILHLV